MLNDIEIARNSTMRNITEIAAELGLNEDDYELYGKYKAKISDIKLPRRGKLILVTAMTPTKQGVFCQGKDNSDMPDRDREGRSRIL